MTWIDIVLVVLLLGWVVLAIWGMRRRKKRGRSLTCGGDCSHCAGHCARKQP